MKKFALVLALTIPTISFAAEAPVQKDAGLPVTGMTIQDCLNINAGLSALDNGYEKVIAAGKPSESKMVEHYDLPNNVRDAQTHDMFVLQTIQQEAQNANRRAQLDIGKGEPIKPGTAEDLKFQDRMAEYSARACKVDLDHFKKDDLLKGGPIPATIRALLWKITD